MPLSNSRKVILVLAACAGLIIGVHVATLIAGYALDRDYVFGLTDWFDVDRERNVPAAFSCGLLLIASALLAVIALRQKHGQLPRAALWTGLAVVFLYLAADEALELHERIARLSARAIGTHELAYYAWLLPYAIGALVFGLVYARFLGQLSRDIRIQFLVAGTIYVAGAMGTEVLAAVYVHFHHTEQALGYDLLSALEESLEMTGVIWFIHALMRHLQKNSAPMPKHRGAVSNTGSPASTST